MKRANGLSVEGWRALVRGGAGARRQRAAGTVRGDRADELVHLERDWPRDLPQGVIHADLFPDNVFFIGDKLSGLIDFYFACTDAFAYDIAICLNAWCFEPDHSYNVTKGRALLNGYRGTRALRRSGNCRAAIALRAAPPCGSC